MFSDPYELRTGDSRVATRTAPHDLANSTADERDLALLDTLATAHKALYTEIGRRIVGMHSIVDNLVVSILSGGHVILIGVPGLAKTLLIQTLAEALDQSFSRIQFTPDLMPSDITGTELLEEDHGTGKRTFHNSHCSSASSRSNQLACPLASIPTRTFLPCAASSR